MEQFILPLDRHSLSKISEPGRGAIAVGFNWVAMGEQVILREIDSKFLDRTFLLMGDITEAPTEFGL